MRPLSWKAIQLFKCSDDFHFDKPAWNPDKEVFILLGGCTRQFLCWDTLTSYALNVFITISLNSTEERADTWKLWLSRVALKGIKLSLLLWVIEPVDIDSFPVICFVGCILEDVRGWVNFQNTQVWKHSRDHLSPRTHHTAPDRWTWMCVLLSFNSRLMHCFVPFKFQTPWVSRRFFIDSPSSFLPFHVLLVAR